MTDNDYKNGSETPNPETFDGYALFQNVKYTSDQVANEWFDNILSRVIIGEAREVHRMHSLFQNHLFTPPNNLQLLYDDQPTASRNPPISTKPYSDISGTSVAALAKLPGTIVIECPRCQRKLAGTRYAPHLEKCMGMGRQSSRVASRRMTAILTTNQSRNTFDRLAISDNLRKTKPIKSQIFTLEENSENSEEEETNGDVDYQENDSDSDWNDPLPGGGKKKGLRTNLALGFVLGTQNNKRKIKGKKKKQTNKLLDWDAQKEVSSRPKNSILADDEEDSSEIGFFSSNQSNSNGVVDNFAFTDESSQDVTEMRTEPIVVLRSIDEQMPGTR